MVAELSPYEELVERAARARQPWDGSIELTHRCNERCGMCYLGPDWGKGLKNQELTTAEWFDVLDQIHAAGCFELLLTGGEVCLRKDLAQIVEHAGKKGMLLTIKSNGTLITPELAAVFARNPVRRVEMSLLGSCAETHDGVTKIPGSFDRTMRAIETLHAAGVPVKLYFTTVSDNMREVVAARRLALSLGCEFDWSTQIQPRDDRSIIPLQMRLPAKEMREMQQLRVDDAKAANGGEWPAAGYSNEGWFCGAGRNSFNINPYGEVQPCILMRMDCGNIREQPFEQIWNEAPEFKRLRGLRIADVYGCNSCAVRDYCSACPGLFFMEMGDVTIPSPHTCEQAEMKHEAATGVWKACGARDAAGNLPRPANRLAGPLGHAPIPLKIRESAKA